MTATDRADAFEVGVAQVNFRVRCETLGHGDEVFLVSDEGQGARKVGCESRVNEIQRRRPIDELFETLKLAATLLKRHELFSRKSIKTCRIMEKENGLVLKVKGAPKKLRLLRFSRCLLLPMNLRFLCSPLWLTFFSPSI